MSFPLHARYAHPDAGWDADQRQAAERLTVGEVYTIQRLEVGRSSSAIFFYEVDNPPFGFNAVLFEPDDGPGMADVEEERATYFVNDLLEHAPEEWDDDVAAESIALHYLRHLEAEVTRLGGDLRPPSRREGEVPQ